MNISKAIIPAAGIGTRFLPLTKTMPKEMLPLLEKPAIQWILEEAVASEISNFFLVTSRRKGSVADYFDSDLELEALLKERGHREAIDALDRLIRASSFTYVRQSDPLGLGHAIWLARHAIGKEYVTVCLPDDIIVGTPPGLSQLIRVARQEKGSVIAVQEVPLNCVSAYGVVEVKKQITPNLCQISRIVEKPAQKDAPSNLAVVGRYVLSHKIFSSLEEVSTYEVGEIQLTDAICHMMRNNEKVFAYKVQGTRYDIGTPLGWLKATIGIGLQHPQYGPPLRTFLQDIDGVNSFMYNQAKNIEHITS